MTKKNFLDTLNYYLIKLKSIFILKPEDSVSNANKFLKMTASGKTVWEELPTMLVYKGSKTSVNDVWALTDAKQGDVWSVENDEYFCKEDTAPGEGNYGEDFWGLFGQILPELTKYIAGDNIQMHDVIVDDETCKQVSAIGYTYNASYNSFAEGVTTTASGYQSHAEGLLTRAVGSNSHAEGTYSIGMGSASHAEGLSGDKSDTEEVIVEVDALGQYFPSPCIYEFKVGNIIEYNGEFAKITAVYNSCFTLDRNPENPLTLVSGEHIYIISKGAYSLAAHAEGMSLASDAFAHSEGYNTTTKGQAAHSEGISTIAEGMYSHAEGNYSHTIGTNSHAENEYTISFGQDSHALGYCTIASGYGAHAEGHGDVNNVSSTWSCSANSNTVTPTDTSALSEIKVGDVCALPDGDTIIYAKVISKASNKFTIDKQLSVGCTNASIQIVLTGIAYGEYSHTENSGKAIGDESHAEGHETIASNYFAHAEGKQTVASGEQSHAEGSTAIATGTSAHAEGYSTTASNSAAHAEGYGVEASGGCSHAEGYYTKATNSSEHAQGEYNVTRTSSTAADATLHSIGIGTGASARVNAVEVRKNGDIYIKGVGNFDGINASGDTLLTTLSILLLRIVALETAAGITYTPS